MLARHSLFLLLGPALAAMSRKRRERRAPASASAPPPVGNWRVSVWLSLGLLAAIVLIYFPVRHYGFVPLDDIAYVPDNLHIPGGLTWDNVWWAFTSRWQGYWIPLTWVSYMAEVQLAGVAPGVMHVTNVLLHAANTLLLFGWLRRTTRATGPSACVAALFAVHPLHVESVAWITERKDVLSTCFMLLALIAYTAFTERRTTGRYLAVCALFVAGLTAKPMLVTLPFIFLLCDVWPLGRVTLAVRTPEVRRRWRAVVWEKLPLVAIAAAGSAAVFLAQAQVGAMVASEVFGFGLRLQNALVSTVVYLGQMLWPLRLIAWYAYPESIPAWQVVAAIVLIAGITFGVLRLVTRPYLAVGWFWYLVTLVPVSGLVQVGLQPRADRFTYVPLIGIFIMVAWGATDLVARWRLGGRVMIATAVAATIACAVVSRQQVTYWRDGEALWRHAADLTPGSGGAQAHFELAKTLVATGRASEALVHLTEAIRAKPDWGAPRAQRGAILARDGRKAEARTDYEEALRLSPDLAETQNDLGVLLANDGQIAEALPHFEAAVRLRPDFESARVNLGVALVRLGRRDDAIRELSAALQINPGNVQARHVLDLLTKGKGG